METLYFFYSEKQKAISLTIDMQNNRPQNLNYVVDDQGIIHEYTLAAKTSKPNVNFDDIVFLCVGTNACVIHNGKPQGHWAEQHMWKFNGGKLK